MSQENEETGNAQKGIDPAKFFNEKEYNTIKIGDETTAKKKEDAGKDLVSLLTSKIIGEKDLALALLKKEKALPVLLDAIKASKNPKNKALLVAACWECGMDFRPHLEFFAELAHDEDLFVSIEAITVLSENTPGLDAKQAQQLINILSKGAGGHFNEALINDAVEGLKALL
ncbi:MAG TPA: hypothetical protein VNY73_02890 [Bacteroidia bacterium]|jgi:hypothetical protein|nr:hypothetical protein [Bacteroidia bacterium]